MTGAQRKEILNKFYRIGKGEKIDKWDQVYEYTYVTFRFTDKGELMEKKFRKNEGAVRIQMEMYIEEWTYYYMLRDIVRTAFRWAQELGIYAKE